MVQLPNILDLLTIPDPEAFRQLSTHFQNWGSQHQEYLQQLNNGHSNLKASWEGDGADTYSQLHAQTQQVGEAHQQQKQEASLQLLAIAALLDAAQMLQNIALAELAGAGIEFILGFFTAGATDALAAPEVADAVANEGLAQAQAQGARLLLQNAFNALKVIIEAWQDHKALFQFGGAILGGASGLTFGITHHESLPQILETTAMDAQTGFEAGENLSSDNPVTAIKELGGMGVGTVQYFASDNRGNEDPLGTIVGMGNMVAGTGGKPEGQSMGLTEEEPTTNPPQEDVPPTEDNVPLTGENGGGGGDGNDPPDKTGGNGGSESGEGDSGRNAGNLDKIFNDPEQLKDKTPDEIQEMAQKEGWKVDTLGKGSHEGQGLVVREVNENGNLTGRMIQWHPGGGQHGSEPYWKVSSGLTGTTRIGPQFDE